MSFEWKALTKGQSYNAHIESYKKVVPDVRCVFAEQVDALKITLFPPQPP
jgi:hypothetical protein